MPSLHIIRHAEPAITGVLTGQSDPPLSPYGREQAALLHAEFDTVYCSPLRRAYETAAFLARQPIVLGELAEISYGDWDGLPWSRIEREWPDLASRKLRDWRGVPAPGGEPWDVFVSRVDRGLNLVLAGPLPAAVVAHEAVNAVIAQRLLGTSADEYKQQFCETRIYEIRAND